MKKIEKNWKKLKKIEKIEKKIENNTNSARLRCFVVFRQKIVKHKKSVFASGLKNIHHGFSDSSKLAKMLHPRISVGYRDVYSCKKS